MANGIASKTRVELHQALHGYAEGHRQLATSMALKPRDEKLTLVLSDVSGAGARIDANGYVTGYPLFEAGMYAFARTWPAPEMPRPGCVWTHTLLIDFADLARLGSLSDLSPAFRRPQGDIFVDYSTTLIVNPSEKLSKIDAVSQKIAKKLISALYGRPNAKIVAAREPELDVDDLVTAIWSQQWPKLRRSFRFCTLAAADRSQDGAVFDLQLFPAGNQALRTRFQDAVDANNVATTGEWLDDVIADLLAPEIEGLRTFLHGVGGDVTGGRAAFPMLCRLYRLIQASSSDSSAFTQAFDLLEDDFGIMQARSARTIIFSKAFAQAASLEDTTLDRLIGHLTLVEPRVIQTVSEDFCRTLLQRRPATLGDFLETEGALQELGNHAVKIAALSDLLSAIKRVPTLVSPILQHRPELILEPDIWSREIGAAESALKTGQSREEKVSILKAVLTAQRSDLANRIAEDFGAFTVLDGLATLLETGQIDASEIRPWLRAAGAPTTIAQFFSTAAGLPRSLIAQITRVTRPDDVPNDYGEDPWMTAIERAKGGIPEAEELHLRAYLLTRGFGPRSRYMAELVQFGFEEIYNAAAASKLPEASWTLIEPRLPSPTFWFEWDHCQRLRAGVAELFVERQLSARTFGHLVRDESLFRVLAEQVMRTWGGRYFLKQVRRALRDTDDESSIVRLGVIERLL